jgi:hypothetical protein
MSRTCRFLSEVSDWLMHTGSTSERNRPRGQTPLGSRLPSLQPLSLSLSASSSQTHRPNIHDAGPPGYSLRIAWPRALGASAETMEVGICQGCLRALPWAGATRLRPGGPFGLSLTEMSFCCPSFSLAVHPIFCSCEELLHPLTLVSLRLPRAFPLRARVTPGDTFLFNSIP